METRVLQRLFAHNELEGGAYQPYAYEPVKTKNDFLGKAYDVWDDRDD